jgi:hypothetical protein
MALTRKQKIGLLKDGFLPKEIFQLTHATGGDKTNTVKQSFNFSSRPFQAMRKSRKNYIRNLKENGWNESEIKAKINAFYIGGKNIYSFLKLEYAPPKKITDFQSAIKLRERSRISRVFGRAYGRRMKRTMLPKYLPKRPMLPNKPRLIRKRSYKLGTK